MNCSMSFHIPKALPSLTRLSHFTRKTTCNFNNNHKNKTSRVDMEKPLQCLSMVGAILATVYEQPALALTGVNHTEELSSVLIQSGIVAFVYVLVAPPIIMNWIRIRQYRRKLLETYLQFMFVFMFFPSIILWAPFLNFRKFPRDPDMKFPWSEPEDPSKIKYMYMKYPFAKPEDYDW